MLLADMLVGLRDRQADYSILCQHFHSSFISMGDLELCVA